MKTPVYFDRLYFQTLVMAHKAALPFLNQVCENYEALSLGPITPDVLNQIAAGNYSEIKSATEAILEADLKKSGFKTKAILRELRAAATIEFEEFRSDAMKLMARFFAKSFYTNTGHYPIEVSHFSIKDGRAFLTEENIQALKEDLCTDYLETDLQHQAWEKLQKAAAALQQVATLLKENGITVPIFWIGGSPGLISSEDHEVQVHGELMHLVK